MKLAYFITHKSKQIPVYIRRPWTTRITLTLPK